MKRELVDARKRKDVIAQKGSQEEPKGEEAESRSADYSELNQNIEKMKRELASMEERRKEVSEENKR